ncbi:MAG: VCBS repeat-containing protein [Myxococcales bacterium]
MRLLALAPVLASLLAAASCGQPPSTDPAADAAEPGLDADQPAEERDGGSTSRPDARSSWDASRPDAGPQRPDAAASGSDAAASGPDASASGPDASAPVPATRFAASGLQWNVPTAGEYDWKVYETYSRHSVVDMDGDGRPDFVDSADVSGGSTVVWGSGGQQYWKVYKNNGSGFDAVPLTWKIPTAGEYDWKIYETYSRHALVDMDGDGRPDFVDSADESGGNTAVWGSGGQQYWKVYKNNGSGFDAVPLTWKIPTAGEYDWKVDESYSRHAVLDMDGDGRPDFVDSADESGGSTAVWGSGGQQYWKVYKNNGSGFDAVPLTWKIPTAGEYDWKVNETYSRHSLVDMDGDGRPDFVDSADESGGSTAIWGSGGQQYWKVYKNNGSGFDAVPLTWAIPTAGEYDWKTYDSYSRHSVLDMDGDGRPDFVDSADQSGGSTVVWGNGGLQFWKVYKNTGTGFAAVPLQWMIPTAGEYDWKVDDSYSRHAVLDLNGDHRADFVDSEDETTAGASDVRKTGTQQFWKVFLGE